MKVTCPTAMEADVFPSCSTRHQTPDTRAYKTMHTGEVCAGNERGIMLNLCYHFSHVECFGSSASSYLSIYLDKLCSKDKNKYIRFLFCFCYCQNIRHLIIVCLANCQHKTLVCPTLNNIMLCCGMRKYFMKHA